MGESSVSCTPSPSVATSSGVSSTDSKWRSLLPAVSLSSPLASAPIRFYCCLWDQQKKKRDTESLHCSLFFPFTFLSTDPAAGNKKKSVSGRRKVDCGKAVLKRLLVRRTRRHSVSRKWCSYMSLGLHCMVPNEVGCLDIKLGPHCQLGQEYNTAPTACTRYIPCAHSDGEWVVTQLLPRCCSGADYLLQFAGKWMLICVIFAPGCTNVKRTVYGTVSRCWLHVCHWFSCWHFILTHLYMVPQWNTS